MRIALCLTLCLLSSVSPAVAQPPALPSQAVLFIEPSEMGSAIAAALIKKKVPVLVTTDKAKATHVLTATTSAEKEGTGERVAKVVMLGSFAGSGKSRDTSVTVVDAAGSLVFAYTTKKASLQSAAEGVAKHIHNHIKEAEKRLR